MAGHEHITNRVYFEGIDPWQPQAVGVWDYARAKQGGVDVVIENVWADDGYNNYNVTVKQVLRLIETFYRVLDENGDKMELALSAADARRIVAQGKLAVILAIEAGFDMEGDVDLLRLFHRLGVRLVQFTNHDTTNAYADARAGTRKWGGINDHGRRLIEEMNRLGIIIDFSHASDAATTQIIEASQAPVVSSHDGMRRFCSNPRNLSDDVLKALAANGGLLGVHSSALALSQEFYDWSRSRQRTGGARPSLPNKFRSPDDDYGKYITDLDAAVRSRWMERLEPWEEANVGHPPLPTVEQWAEQVDYAVSLVGPDHVALGFDMSRGGGYLRDFDASRYPRITEALLSKGYSEETVGKILGGNWLRLLDEAKYYPPTSP